MYELRPVIRLHRIYKYWNFRSAWKSAKSDWSFISPFLTIVCAWGINRNPSVKKRHWVTQSQKRYTVSHIGNRLHCYRPIASINKIRILEPFQWYTFPRHTRARGYKTFFVLNSVEHEISNAHKYKNINKFSFCQAQISGECYFSCS